MKNNCKIGDVTMKKANIYPLCYKGIPPPARGTMQAEVKMRALLHYYSSKNGIIFCDISDHLPIVHVRNSKNYHKKPSKTEFTCKRIINDTKVQSFTNTIKNISWENVLSENNTTESYNKFFNLFSIAYEKNFPLTKKVAKRKIDKIRSPWMTRCIAKSVKQKNKLYKKYLQYPTEKNEKIYKKYKNKLNHVIKVAKKKYYEEQLINYKHDTKVLWKTLNEIMNRNKTSRMLPKEFNGNSPGEQITDPNTTANRFNDYFVNIDPGLAKKLPNSKTTFDKYFTNSCKNSFFINPITKYELENEINNLNAKKSPGYDGISSQVIKAIATEISEPLSHIFNLTFLSGTIPDDLKIALVTPIFKANENNEFKNYQPISVPTCFSKLLEKLMYKRLINHIEKNNILTQHQYGFRENRSTDLAIIELVDRIMKAIDKGEYTIGIFLDLSKAFDTQLITRY